MRTLIVAISLGVCVGLGAFTAHYANATAYLSDSPSACTNCHVMQQNFAEWQKSSHHTAAVCNDCHVPVSFFGKWLSKAENGYHHSAAFTLQNFAEPIRAKPKSQAIVQNNCIRCHQPIVGNLVAHANEASSERDCVHCHASVGHAASD